MPFVYQTSDFMGKYFVLDSLFIYCTWNCNLRNTRRYEWSQL